MGHIVQTRIKTKHMLIKLYVTLFARPPGLQRMLYWQDLRVN